MKKIEKALPTGLLTHFETIDVLGEPLQILTVFCNAEQKEQIIKAAVKVKMPFERTEKGVKLYN